MQNKPPFIADPQGSASTVVKSSGGGGPINPNRPQPSGTLTSNADSVPAGGSVLKADPGAFGAQTGGVQGVSKKPFKLIGDAAPAQASDAASVGSAGDE